MKYRIIILFLILVLTSSVVNSVSFPAESLNPYYNALKSFVNVTLNEFTGNLQNNLNISSFDINISRNLTVLGNITANAVFANNLSGKLSCSDIIGSPDSDFCADIIGDASSYNRENITLYLGGDGNASLIRTTNLTSRTLSPLFVIVDTQTLIVHDNLILIGNITDVNVANININGSLLPAIDNLFFTGNGSFRFVDGNWTGTIEVGSLTSPTIRVTNLQKLNSVAWVLSDFSNDLGFVRGVDFNLQNISNNTYPPSSYYVFNITNYLGNTNSSRILSTNLSTLDTLDLYIRVKDFSTGNVSNNTLTKGDNTTTALWNVSGNNIYPREISGNVGIGTNSPQYLLQVANVSNAVNLSGILYINGSNGNVGIGTTAPGTILHIKVTGEALRSELIDNTNFIQYSFFEGTTKKAAMSYQGSGSGSSFIGGAGALVFGTLTTNSTVLFTNSVARLTVNGDGNVGIGNTNPTEVLTVTGNVSISGTNCKDSGGSATCNNFVDIAELFSSSEEVESGDVVVIDLLNENNIKKSQKPYDTSVIGIVSTQPAIVIEGDKVIAMGGSTFQSNTLKPAIALAGRVPVKVTNENGMVKAGDLLTTSSKKGYAMKCSKPINCIGSVIGVAMESQKINNDIIMAIVK